MYLERPIFGSGTFGARKISKKVENDIFFMFWKNLVPKKISLDVYRASPEHPRIFRFLLGLAADDVRDQIFGFKNPGQFFFPR